MADEVLNGYRFLSLLMTGQTSQVWQVLREEDRRYFALKLLLPERVRDPAHRGFLVHEARVGLDLKHENVIRVHEFFPERKNPHFVMEYFPSINLKLRIIYKQPMVREKMVEIMSQTCQALAHMHERKWVHKDVKPDNVLVSDGAKVRLIDFALADRIKTGWQKLFGGRSAVMGTRSYMSPEQIRGQRLDGRSDIYSLGVTLFELVTCRRPFVADNPDLLLKKHLYGVPDAPRAYNPQVTEEFEELILRMMSKKRENRPESMMSFLAEFRHIRHFND